MVLFERFLRLMSGLKLGEIVARSLLVLGLAFVPIAAAYAETKVSTKVKYHNVRGNSSEELLVNLLKKPLNTQIGPAFGVTEFKIDLKQKPKLDGKRCSIPTAEFIARMVITLPRATSHKKLDGKSRKVWDQFARYVEVHEKKHQTIMYGCLSKMARRLERISAPDCKSVSAQADKILAEEGRACHAKHLAFDRRDSNKVLQLPFFKPLRELARALR